MRLPEAEVLRYVSWACPGRTDAKIKKKSSKDNPRVQAWMTTVSEFNFFRSKTDPCTGMNDCAAAVTATVAAY